MPSRPTIPNTSASGFRYPLTATGRAFRTSHSRGEPPAPDSYSRRWAPYTVPAPPTPISEPTTKEGLSLREDASAPDVLDAYLIDAQSLAQDEQIARHLLVGELRSLGLYPLGRRPRAPLLLPLPSTHALKLDERYAALTQLPPLTSLRFLSLEDLPLIKTLPRSLQLSDGLSVRRCASFESVPSSVRVCGDVSFAYCPNLVSFPPSIADSGSLYLQGPFPALRLPAGLHVHKQLAVIDDPTRTTLFIEGSQACLGSLVLRRLPNLTALNLPDYVPEDLDIDECAALDTVKECLRVGRRLTVTACPSLRFLARQLSVGGDLTIAHCVRLDKICDRFLVGGDLSLRDLPDLRDILREPSANRDASLSVEHNIFPFSGFSVVEKSLMIAQVPQLALLPESLRVGRDLKINACVNVRSLPEALFGWPEKPQITRTVSLIATGLRWFPDCERLERMVPRAMLLFHGRTENHFSSYNPSQVAKRNLHSLLAFFHREADLLFGREKVRSRRWLDFALTSQKEALKIFLRRLLDAEDLSPSQWLPADSQPRWGDRNRQHLIIRISSFLDRLSEMATEWDELFSEIAHAVGGCSDRVLQSFGHCERFLLVHDALRDETQKEQRLIDLAGGLYRLDLLHQWAFRNSESLQLRINESSEFILYLENALRVELKLPVHTFSMNFPNAGGNLRGVPQQALIDITAVLKSAEGFTAYLASWEPWQTYQRQQTADALRFADLPLLTSDKKVVDGVCPLTLEPLESLLEPVALPFEGSHHIFELSDFLMWWTQNPRHPLLSHPLPTLSDLMRLR